MAVNLSPVGGVAAQFFNNDGTVLSGGKLNTYTAGTTTPATTYTNSGGTIAHSNPIIFNSAGRVPASGEIWLTDGITYKFVLTDANNVLIATYDNISGINSNFINFLTENEYQTATAGQTVFTLTTMQYQPGTNSLNVFVDGVNQYGPGAQYSFTETNATTVTFNNGLHVGAAVRFTTAQSLSSGATDASLVTYTPPFTGSTSTTVENKLAQYVSVIDFGAVGDGVTDDSSAIANAVAVSAGKNLFYPSGTYLIASNITIPENVCSVMENGAEFSINSAVTVTIYGPVVATNYPYWTGSGTMVSYAFQQNNQRTVMWQQPASPLANADIYLNNIRDKMFQVIATSQLPTSTTSVTAGTGLKTWTIQPGLRLAADFGVNVWAHRDSDGLYMQGFIDSYDNTTGQLTLDVFNNQLASATAANWYFTVASDPFSVFQYGGATKGASQGLYCQVASAGGSSRPYNYVIALYGGNGTVPCMFGLPNGGTGFGTEVPNQRIHVVGADGTQTSGIRLTESLPLERGLTAYPHSGGYSVLGSYDWGSSAFYPLRFTSQARAQMDFNKTCPLDSSVLIATVSLPNYGAVYVKVQAGGIVVGGGGAGAYSEFKLSRDTGNVTITPVTQSNWGYGSAGWYRIEENVSGSDAQFYLLMNSSGGSPGTWNGIGNLEVMGKAVVTMA
jgi:hypothetical protein